MPTRNSLRRFFSCGVMVAVFGAFREMPKIFWREKRYRHAMSAFIKIMLSVAAKKMATTRIEASPLYEQNGSVDSPSSEAFRS